MKLKVLPFPFWGAWEVMEWAGDTVKDVLGKDPKRVPAYVGKPGWYLDRESGVSWYEFPDGKAYEAPADYFRHVLKAKDREERPLSAAERAAIQTLLVYGNVGRKVVRGALGPRLWDELYRLQLRQTEIEVGKWRVQDRKRPS